MNRLGTVFWLCLVMGSGFAMYMVKYGVQNLESDLARVRKQTVAAQLEMRVLDAEWSYLTQPERLAALNRQFLQLGPITPKQLETTIAEIPLRPPPAPPAEMVAEAPPAAAPSASQAIPASASAPAPARPGDGLPVTPVALETAPEAAPQTPAPTPARATRALDQLFAQVAGAN